MINTFDFTDDENMLGVEIDGKSYSYLIYSRNAVKDEQHQEYFYNFPDDFHIIKSAYLPTPTYSPRKLIYEDLKKYFYKYAEIVVKVNSASEGKILAERIGELMGISEHRIDDGLDDIVDFPNYVFIRPNEIQYLNKIDLMYLTDIDVTDELLQDNIDHVVNSQVFTMGDWKKIEKILLYGDTIPTPTYTPRKLIYESSNNKVLHAFDMDDTLVYSKRFEEHVRPLLVTEYLNPEIILNNKLEDIGIGLDKLRYENGRIYFDDPDEEIKIPKGSSWVRKKGRIYIIQPDAYFMTDESMPIGTYDDIVDLYNNSEYKCIITARNERLRNQTEKTLDSIGIEEPNMGLYMYPINSFSYTYEYKSNKLLELQRQHNFSEIIMIFTNIY